VGVADAPGQASDHAHWTALIDDAVDDRDPVLSNLRITLAHQQLSLAVQRLIGPSSGANFHTWAVWGSKTAGRTIRREDLPLPSRAVMPAGALGGAGTVAAATRGRSRGMVAGGACVGVAAGYGVGRLEDRAARSIFGGNATVLDDIGRQSARFLTAAEDDAAFSTFLDELRPGPPESGGQDLLHGAYRHYREASQATDADRRDEMMLYGNLLAILHEHHRLEPYIEGSLPRPLRRLVTARLLGFAIGHESMRVSANVAPDRGVVFPKTLTTIEDRDLRTLLDGPGGLDRTPDSLDGSAAEDWTSLSDRMNFICDLFRSRQLDPELFEPPFTEEQQAAIAAGRVPAAGRL
jgi:hypothetical protein